MARKFGQRASARTASLPAPTGGWNAKDSLAEMAPEDAVTLTNWFPTPSFVSLRQGMVKWATGLPSQVNSVMAYNAGSASKLFAASGAGIYDCTSGGAVGASVVSGLTSDKFLHTNVATAGGNFLYAVNGTDSPLLYDGTTWKSITGVSTPAITGVTTSNLSNVYLAKQRLWFIEKNSLRAWYLPVLSVGGAASALDFSSLCRRGGYLVAMAEWTVSGGFGVQDLVAFITSEGELLIYQGSDPTVSTAWSLSGIWHMGSPMGPKCFAKAGADLLLIGKDGLTPMSQGQFFADMGNKGTLTDKIQWAISNATTLYSGNWGWQVQIFPLANALLLNVPVGVGQQQQYVMNTVTGAWCNFTGWHANAWEMYHDQIYFGDNGFVGKAWTGYDDAGAQIAGDAQQAFNYFGSRGQLKRWTMMRPLLTANGQPSVLANLNVDFDSTPPAAALAAATTGLATWDSAHFDVAQWVGDQGLFKQWQGVNGVGYCAAPRLLAAGKGITLNWMATDLVMERGDVI